MELVYGLLQALNSAESSSGSGSGTAIDRIIDLLSSKFSFERQTVAFPGDPRYLTPLLVFGNRQPEAVESSEQLAGSESSLPRTTDKSLPTKTPDFGFTPAAENIVPYDEEVKERIRTALKLLTFREQRVLIQFWSPRVVGKHRLLSTVDQPFGLGIVDEGLCSYRRESECNPFVVDEEYEEDNLSPPARVFRRGLPEWSSDVTNYMQRDYPQKDRAIRCKLRGSLALPVFESSSRLCVGVLELLTSSLYLDYGYEVQEIHKALKAANLSSPQVFDYPISHVPKEHRQNELDKIFGVLKLLSHTYDVPIAQTWAASPFSSFVAHGENLEKSCSSFNTRCIGKVCMSTAALPFHVQDLDMWHFREACREKHLEKSQGVVGRALLSRSSCFCGDVTKLSEDDYPLVHNARMSRLTSCFAIYLHSVEGGDDYVLEFFLPSDIKDSRYLLNLVQTLKQNIDVASGFELGNIMSTEVIGMSREVSQPSLNMEPDIIQTSPTTMANALILLSQGVQLDSEDRQLMVENNAKIDCENFSNQCSMGSGHHQTDDNVATDVQKMAVDDVTSNKVNIGIADRMYSDTPLPTVNMQKKSDIFTSTGDKSDSSKQGRKRKIGSLTLEELQQHFGMPIAEAANRLGVSRSTLKRICRELNISSWPLPKRSNKNTSVPNSLSEKPSVDHGINGSLNARFGIFNAVFLLVRVKRWICSSNHHGVSGRWWICGKHKNFLSGTMQSKESYASTGTVIPITNQGLDEHFSQAVYGQDFFLLNSKLSKESSNSTGIGIPISKSSNVHFGIYNAASLLVRLIRWRKRKSIRHEIENRDYLAESAGNPDYPYLYTYQNCNWQVSDTSVMLRDFHASSPKGSAGNISDSMPSDREIEDSRRVTIKATFKDNMIKFQFPFSSGLSELEKRVAERIKLKVRSFRLKYKDEDDDLILIACDADLRNLLGSLGSNSTIKLIVQLSEN